MKLIKPENKPVTFRRLLLAKKLFLHGLEHSNKVGDLNKIIAVHNFHNAIEIALKAIVLNYEIRAENQLNIDFETLLNQIDNFQEFKDRGQKLPYRQEVRKLNQLRNLVQHHGTEPESSTMEEWRVISKNIQVRIFDEYFGCDFDQMSSISLINDCRLRQLMELSSEKISNEAWFESASMSKIAFLWGSSNIYQSLPSEGGNSKSHATLGIRHMNGNGSQEILKSIETVFDRIKDIERLTAILSSGISLLDYKKFSTVTPPVAFVSSGAPVIYKKREIFEEDSKWVQ